MRPIARRVATPLLLGGLLVGALLWGLSRYAPAAAAAPGRTPLSDQSPSAPERTQAPGRLTSERGRISGVSQPGGLITVCLDGGCDYASIQEAVDAAEDGDEIRVASGVYGGVTSRQGSIQVAYVGKSVTVRGGYTLTDWTTSNPISNPTTLDAAGQGRVLTIAGTVSPTIEGLRIVGGDAGGLGGIPGADLDAGGGVYVITAAASIRNCEIVGNVADRGAGIYVHRGSVHLADNTLSGNLAETGAGAYFWDSDPHVEENRFIGNEAHSLGGGLYLRGGEPVLEDNLVTSNTAEWGGGFYLERADARLVGNEILSNTAAYGGGLVSNNGSPRLIGNLVRANAAEYAAGLFLSFGAPTVRGNTVDGNEAQVLGGGLYILEGTPLVVGNSVSRNTGGWGAGVYLDSGDGALVGNGLTANVAQISGGGIYVYRAEALLLENTLMDNVAAYGGGLHLHRSSALLRDNVLLANAADYGGGGYLDAGQLAMTNTVVARNAATALGSGLYVSADSSARLLHTTLVGSAGPGSAVADGYESVRADDEDGTGIFVASGAVTLTNTIIVAHARGLYISSEASVALRGTLWGSGAWSNQIRWQGTGGFEQEGDLSGDPAFAAPGVHDYHLLEASDARDAGVVSGARRDIDGDPRPVGPGFDLGADEWTILDLSGSSKDVSAGRADVGDVLTYTLVLHNAGLSPSENTLLFDPIPARTTLISGSVSASSGLVSECSGIRWAGTLTPAQPISITYRVTVNEAGGIVNTAVVTDQHGLVTRLTAWVNPHFKYLPQMLN